MDESAAIQTIRQIAEGERRPCAKCLAVHEPQTDPKRPNLAPQWHHPDGHYYEEMTVRQFAQFALRSLLAESTS